MIVDLYFNALTNYAGFAGRARRKEFWIFQTCNALVVIALMIFDDEIEMLGGGHKYWIASICFIVAMVLPSVAVSVRRLHDVNASGWWLLTFFVPPIFALVILVYMLRDSDTEENRYGPNPKTDLSADPALQTDVKRIRRLVFDLVIVSLVLLGVRYDLARREQIEREAGYQSILHEYSQALKPGMNRKEVEDYLHAKNAAIGQFCCVDPKQSFARHTWDDRTKIGEESVPWFCSKHNMYIDFQFTDQEGAERGEPTEDNDKDTLKAISLHGQLEGCL